MSGLTRDERAELSADDFADPINRTMPLEGDADVKRALFRSNTLSEPRRSEVRRRIVEVALRKGLKMPPSLGVEAIGCEVGMHSAGQVPPREVEIMFKNNFVGQVPRTEGEFIIRTGKIFEAADYPDKQFYMTPEEMLAAVRDFRPVPVDLEHTSTVLDGKLGELRAVEVGDDGRSLWGEVALPAWLDRLLGDGERKVSCTWDRATRRLSKLALVRWPRVSDAALLAAFSSAQMQSRHDTSSGQMCLQEVHDTTARHGAVCKKPTNLSADEFVSRHESDKIQKLHDLAVEGGAKCGERGSPYFSDAPSAPGDPRARARAYAEKRNQQIRGQGAAPPQAEVSQPASGNDPRERARRHVAKRNRVIEKQKSDIEAGLNPFWWKQTAD